MAGKMQWQQLEASDDNGWKKARRRQELETAGAPVAVAARLPSPEPKRLSQTTDHKIINTYPAALWARSRLEFFKPSYN